MHIKYTVETKKIPSFAVAADLSFGSEGWVGEGKPRGSGAPEASSLCLGRDETRPDKSGGPARERLLPQATSGLTGS